MKIPKKHTPKTGHHASWYNCQILSHAQSIHIYVYAYVYAYVYVYVYVYDICHI